VNSLRSRRTPLRRRPGLPAAYVLARQRGLISKVGLGWILLSQMFPLILIVIPLFLVLKDLHLVNTHAGLVLVYVVWTLPFALWMLQSYVRGIPKDLEEAALVDGSSRLTVLRTVIVPLLMPGIVVTALARRGLNEFFLASSCSTPHLTTLPPCSCGSSGRRIVRLRPPLRALLRDPDPVIFRLARNHRQMLAGVKGWGKTSVPSRTPKTSQRKKEPDEPYGRFASRWLPLVTAARRAKLKSEVVNTHRDVTRATDHGRGDEQHRRLVEQSSRRSGVSRVGRHQTQFTTSSSLRRRRSATSSKPGATTSSFTSGYLANLGAHRRVKASIRSPQEHGQLRPAKRDHQRADHVPGLQRFANMTILKAAGIKAQTAKAPWTGISSQRRRSRRAALGVCWGLSADRDRPDHGPQLGAVVPQKGKWVPNVGAPEQNPTTIHDMIHTDQSVDRRASASRLRGVLEFFAGKCAMTVQGNYQSQGMITQAPGLQLTIFPVLKGTTRTRLNRRFSDRSAEPAQAEVKKFIAYALSTSNASETPAGDWLIPAPGSGDRRQSRRITTAANNATQRSRPRGHWVSFSAYAQWKAQVATPAFRSYLSNQLAWPWSPNHEWVKRSTVKRTISPFGRAGPADAAAIEQRHRKGSLARA
jgi:hypothetical protein